MWFYSGKSVVTSPAYTHMESFSAGQCPWAVTGEGGQLLRATVAVRAAYTVFKILLIDLIGSGMNTERTV